MKKVLVLSWERDGGKEVCSVSGVTDGEGVEEWSLFLEQREGQEEKAIWSKMVVSEVLDPGIWRRGTG